MLAIGQKLRDARLNASLNQRQAASRLHLSIATLSNYENNVKSPSLSSFLALCQLYRVSADFLLGLDKEEAIPIGHLSVRQKELIHGVIAEFLEN